MIRFSIFVFFLWHKGMKRVKVQAYKNVKVSATEIAALQLHVLRRSYAQCIAELMCKLRLDWKQACVPCPGGVGGKSALAIYHGSVPAQRYACLLVLRTILNSQSDVWRLSTPLSLLLVGSRRWLLALCCIRPCCDGRSSSSSWSMTDSRDRLRR